jgi:hypothetical protein
MKIADSGVDDAPTSELRQLLDKQDIAEPIYKYAEGIDRRDGDLPKTLFTPTACCTTPPITTSRPVC